MRLVNFFIVCVLSACAATTVCAQGAPSQVTVIRAGKLVDSDAGKVLDRPDHRDTGWENHWHRTSHRDRRR